MADCGCHSTEGNTQAERRVIAIALFLNAAMFLVEGTAGWIAGSSALLADAFDMMADAVGYAIALAAIGRAAAFKTRAATGSGLLLAILGVIVILETLRRAIFGGEPEGEVMLQIALLALIVNSVVLVLLARYRRGEVHLRASWIFTRADVIANMVVIVAAVTVKIMHSRRPDILIGFAIGIYVMRKAIENRRMAASTRPVSEIGDR